MESRAAGAVQTIDTSIADETVLTYTPANAATNSLTHGTYLYFTCFEKGIWNFAYDLATFAILLTQAHLFGVSK